MPAAERQQETGTNDQPLRWWSPIAGRIRVSVLLRAIDPLGLLEPGAVKAALRILRPRGSNAPGLPNQQGRRRPQGLGVATDVSAPRIDLSLDKRS